jgi:hypothetical protein
VTDHDPFENAYFAARGRARLTSTGDLLRIESRLRGHRDHLDADELARWAAVRSVLTEREVDLLPLPDAAT